ncbi:organic cation transporter protein-like [Helicoverpa zea]|uniref:organic cation transporter protein-like n=1 Tax=Helicoverpa zea TaxID=7113 RepID=UPI001F5AEAAF|nr:organic cation transporter protein-like [Helicoverpa zea]XP_047034701.1 organic cation transporter protein-like [Helicoverpa zea]
MVIKIANQVTNTTKKEDGFVKLIGDFGKWQCLVIATVSLVKLSSGWVQMAILFLTPNLTFRCVDMNSTIEVENSTCYKECLQYEYDTSPFENTIVSEWDLICERRWLASFNQMMLQVGILIGSIIFGFLSDRYGRKHTFLVAISTLIIFGLAQPFSPNYLVFTILRFLVGMATSGTMVVSFVIVMESVGPRYREVTGCLFQIPFIIGHMTVPLFAYYFRSWNSYLLALGIPPLIYLGYFFVLSESPRWLVSVGRVKEATEIVKRAALLNNLPTTKIEETLTQMSQEICAKSDAPKLNYSSLFQRSLLLKTCYCCTMWLITGIVYFGFNQYISQTSPDPFISVALAAAMQIPALLISIWLIKKFGRRLTTTIFFCLGGLCVIILYFVPQIFAVTLTLGTLGVSCGSIVASTIYIYTSELYPTVIRNMAMGACSTAMRIGSMAAPFIANTSVTVPWLPTAIFGLAPIVAGLACLLLPETKGRILPDSIEDVRTGEK